MLSLPLILLVCLSACKSAPSVDVGVSDPESGGMQMQYKDGTAGLKPYADTGNFICHPAPDYKALIEYFQRQCNQ